MSSPGSVGMLTWSSPVPTGGNVYDDRLEAALLAEGVTVRRHRASGTWPADSERHRGEVAELVAAEDSWLVDSIVACAVPDLAVAASDRGRPWVILLHSLLSTEVGLSPADQRRYRELEATALRAARVVITTSGWAADDLLRRYGVTRTVVAHPGVDRADLVAGGPDGGRLLCLASVTPTKNQLGLVAALSKVSDRAWSARLVGGDRVRPDYTAAVREAIDRHRLSDRVMITGPLAGRALERAWTETDLLVMTSRSETYGMVVGEALSHGIPAIVSAGTGAVEALGSAAGQVPGVAVPPGDTDATADALRSWLDDAALRQRWRLVARQRRETLSSWERCASTVRAALTDGPPARP